MSVDRNGIDAAILKGKEDRARAVNEDSSDKIRASTVTPWRTMTLKSLHPAYSPNRLVRVLQTHTEHCGTAQYVDYLLSV